MSEITNFRSAITDTENYLKTLPPTDCPVKHYFVDGLYAREIYIPAGTMITGAIHKTEHLCVMSGDIGIFSEYTKKRLTGYHMFISKPGEKRLGYAFKDTFFTTLHPTTETDVDTLEKTLVCKTYTEYDQFLLDVENNKLLGK